MGLFGRGNKKGSMTPEQEEIEQLTKMVLIKGIDVNTKYNKGRTLLHLASGVGHTEAVKVLISNGANVNAKDNEGLTSLHFAAGIGHSELAQVLISNGADVNAKQENSGSTPLYSAVINGHTETAKLLLSNGANVNAKININAEIVGGFIPLHATALGDNVEIAKLLLENGADVNAKDNDGLTPLDLARKEGKTKVADLLYSAVCTPEATSLQNSQGGGCPEGYMEAMRPIDETNRCSDQECPCPPPGTVIPRGKGYIYISQEVVDFRRDCPTMKQATEKIKRMENSMGASIVISGPGVVVPILMCKQGAKKRGLDLKVAQEDARSWWETGLVPLRATPMAR